MDSVLQLHHIKKIFDDTSSPRLHVLEEINLEIKLGEFFIFVGPSGSGKSTLLRIMSGLEKSYQGQIHLGEGITKRDMSFVFQQFALLPWLTVYENIGLGLASHQMSKEEREGKIKKELGVFGLEKFARAYPKELSGGMRQRVGIARALVTEPKVIFMDEPFSELDSFTADELRKELLAIWAERKPTIVMVTHIIPEALELADRIAVLTDRPARIEKIVVNTLPRPRHMRSPDFYHLEDELYQLVKP